MNKLFESFEVGDLINILSHTLHIDEFKSKLGKDDKNIVISFLLHDKSAGEDLVDFLERGYEFILDADISSSEVTPGNYLVFAELLRRTRASEQIAKILSDLSAATNTKIKDWSFEYMNSEHEIPFTIENFNDHVPLSPKAYRIQVQNQINEFRSTAGLKTKILDEKVANDLKSLQHAAGLI